MKRRSSYDRRSSGGGFLPKAFLVLLLVAGLVLAVRGAFRTGGEPTVTIVPANKPRESAKPVITEIALVEQ